MTIHDHLIALLERHSLDGLLISHPDSIAYVAGFRGLVPTDREMYAFVTPDVIGLVVPKMYEESARMSLKKGVQLVVQAERTNLLTDTAAQIGKGRNIGIESENLTYMEFDLLCEWGMKLTPLKAEVSQLRIIKTKDEIERIRQAQQLTYDSLHEVSQILRPGVTELEVSHTLSQIMSSKGAEGESFDSIIAFGKGAAQPHYKTGSKKLKKEDLILIDCGALYQGYCGDTTRMFFLQTPEAHITKKYEYVLEAQQAAIDGIKAGMTGEDGFNLANDIFIRVGMEDRFIHGLGHGIGVACHEAPSLRSGSKTQLEEGMVFSIEPGLYDSSWGGIRIEDLVVCHEDTVEVLGKFPRELTIL